MELRCALWLFRICGYIGMFTVLALSVVAFWWSCEAILRRMKFYQLLLQFVWYRKQFAEFRRERKIRPWPRSEAGFKGGDDPPAASTQQEPQMEKENQ